MILQKDQKGDQINWILLVDEPVHCFHCGRLITVGEYAYFCDKGKVLSCMDEACKNIDNLACRFKGGEKEHTHFFVRIFKTRKEKQK